MPGVLFACHREGDFARHGRLDVAFGGREAVGAVWRVAEPVVVVCEGDGGAVFFRDVGSCQPLGCLGVASADEGEGPDGGRVADVGFVEERHVPDACPERVVVTGQFLGRLLELRRVLGHSWPGCGRRSAGFGLALVGDRLQVAVVAAPCL